MPAFLLNGAKHGRKPKTYGVKNGQFGTMKIALLCVVITLSRCEWVFADRELYPGLNYDLDAQQTRPSLSNIDESTFYDNVYQPRPWQRLSIDEDDSSERAVPRNDLNAEKLVKLYSLLKIASDELGNRHHTNRYDKLLQRVEDRYKQLLDTTDRINFLDQYYFNSPNGQRLEEARIFPQEDDFIFNDEEENNFEDPREEAALQDMNPATSIRRKLPTPAHGMHHDDQDYHFKVGEEFPSTSFKDIPIVKDPSEFGVSPSDPRFFEKTSAIGTESLSPDTHYVKPPIQYPQPKAPTNRFNNIHPRSESSKDQRPEEEYLAPGFRSKMAGHDVEVVAIKPDISQPDTTGVYIIAIVAGISAAATVGLIAVGIGWYNLQKHMKNAEDADYPSYGIVGPNKDYEKRERDDAGDRRLAQSAQMYHYQHQKQQIIAMGRNPQGGHGSLSDTDEEEDEEGNYTVYECPGLASIEGPLEVKNPMFDDDQLTTPSQTPSKPTNSSDAK